MRTAIFGGAFDPIHMGHLWLAREFAIRLKLERIILIPSFVPPHKLRSDMASAYDRLEMCRLATEDDTLFTVSDIEIKRGGASFTADTLDELYKLYPDTEWYLITGADMFLTLATWNRFSEIAKRTVLCAAPRDGADAVKLREYAFELERKGARCVIEDIPELTLSSTELRERIRAGESLKGLVPAKVEQFIINNKLYKNNTNKEGKDDQLIDIIRGRLSPRRFTHSIEVAKQAKHLAQIYGADPEKAYTAGILHDIMKDADGQTQLQIMSDFGIIPDNIEMSLPTCWHAVAGAAFIKNILEIDDPDIINSVRYHTTARAGMSPLEITIFVADITSADRDYPDVDKMRRLAETGKEPAMIYALSYTICNLVCKHSAIHPDAIQAYNEFVVESKGGKNYAAK